jgi:hypothetical protein
MRRAKEEEEARKEAERIEKLKQISECALRLSITFEFSVDSRAGVDILVDILVDNASAATQCASLHAGGVPGAAEGARAGGEDAT